LQLVHVLGVDLLERAVTLVVVAHTIGQHITRCCRVVFERIQSLSLGSRKNGSSHQAAHESEMRGHAESPVGLVFVHAWHHECARTRHDLRRTE
jgi:hypothetical protein